MTNIKRSILTPSLCLNCISGFRYPITIDLSRSTNKYSWRNFNYNSKLEKNNLSNYKDFKILFTTTAILHTDNQEKSDELKLENPVTPEKKIDVSTSSDKSTIVPPVPDLGHSE